MLIDEFVENKENLTLQRFEFNLPAYFFTKEKKCVSENVLVTYLQGGNVGKITVSGLFSENNSNNNKKPFSYEIRGKFKLVFDDFIKNYQQSKNNNSDICKKNVFEFVLSDTICCNNKLQSWRFNSETSEIICNFLNQFKSKMQEDLYEKYKEYRLYCCIYHMIFK